VDAAAYRAGERLQLDGKFFDYTKRRDIVHSEILLPEKVPLEFFDRQTLWSAAELAENRKDSRIAHEVLISFPRELTFETSIIMAKELISKCFLPLGMCVDLAVHRGDLKDKGHIEADHKDIYPHNPHGHIMLSTRHAEPEGFSEYKAREWETYGNSELLIGWRREWADIQNRMFERKGLDYRVSHERSNDRERGENERGRGFER
jgi:hypothetical protein